MEKQKSFASSIFLRGIFVLFFAFESAFHVSYYYYHEGIFIIWVLLRLIDSGTLLFMMISAKKLLLQFQDKRYMKFTKLLRVIFAISSFLTIVTIILPIFEFLGVDNFIHDWLELMNYIYQILVWIINLLFLIMWYNIHRYMISAKNKKIFQIANFVLLSSILVISMGFLPYFVNIIDFYREIEPAILSDWIFISSIIVSGVIFLINAIAYILLGIRLFYNPIFESEEFLVKK